MSDYRTYATTVSGDCYLEDKSLLGIIKEFKPGDIEWKTVDIETLGQVVVYKAPVRVMEALTGMLTFSHVEPIIARQAYNPTQNYKFQIHKYVDVNGPDGLDINRSYTLITIAHIRFFKTGFGGLKLGEAEDVELEWTCSRLVQRIHDSEDILLEVDVFKNRAGNADGQYWPQS